MFASGVYAWGGWETNLPRFQNWGVDQILKNWGVDILLFSKYLHNIAIDAKAANQNKFNTLCDLQYHRIRTTGS
jgi:hypothetical protein